MSANYISNYGSLAGPEIARLYFLALNRLCKRSAVKLPGKSLLMDLGSGTSSLALMSGNRLQASVDDHFGTYRLVDQFAELLDSPELFSCIDRYAQGAVHMLRRRLDASKLQHVLVTGTEVRWLLQRVLPSDELLPRFEFKTIKKLHRELRTMEPAQRLEWSDSTLAIPPLCCQQSVSSTTGAAKPKSTRSSFRNYTCVMACSPIADKKGLNRHQLQADDLLATARRLAKRYGMDMAYARNTANLSRQIFQQTQQVHQLNERALTLLEFAAWVHDVGAWVSIREQQTQFLYPHCRKCRRP